MTEIKPPEFAPPALPTTAPQARPIPGKIKAAILALHNRKAKNWTQAAKAAGISREYLSRTLSARPDIITWADNRARRLMALGVNVAAPNMLDLMHSSSARVAFEATRHVLATAGIAPASSPGVSVNVELKAGYVIDLRERSDRSPLPNVTIDGAGAVIDAKPVE